METYKAPLALCEGWKLLRKQKNDLKNENKVLCELHKNYMYTLLQLKST